MFHVKVPVNTYLNGHSEYLEKLLSPISTNGSIRTQAEERRNLGVPRSHSNKTSFAIQNGQHLELVT